MKIERYASSVGLVVGHLGFCPKYRHKIFRNEEIKERFVELLYEVEERHKEEYKIQIDEIGVYEDHAHIVVRSGMNCSPAKLTQLFKGYTSRMLFKEFPWLRKKYFWGGKLWTKSHFYVSTGYADYNTTKNYVKNQTKKHEEERNQTKLTGFLAS